MKIAILCANCKTRIGIEQRGQTRFYDRKGSYYYSNTFMGKNYGGEDCGEQYCKDCYEKIVKETD